MTQNRWVIQSESDPNKTYEITKVGDMFACSCPDFIYREEHDCKHILKIKKRLEKEKRDKDETC